MNPAIPGSKKGGTLPHALQTVKARIAYELHNFSSLHRSNEEPLTLLDPLAGRTVTLNKKGYSLTIDGYAATLRLQRAVQSILN